MKRTPEQKNDGCYFSQDQIDSLQLLYANFRVAHSIEPAIKAFEKALGSMNFSDISKIIRTNDRIAKVIFPESPNKSDESVVLQNITTHLFCNKQGTAIHDLKSFFQTLNEIAKVEKQVHDLKNSGTECAGLEVKLDQVLREKERFENENCILRKRLDNARQIKQNL